MRYVCTLDNLNCAHCAGKIEQKIAQTEGFEKVSFNFATKQLRFSSGKSDALSEIQKICDSIEDGVTVSGASPKKKEKDGEKLERLLLIAAAVLGAAALVIRFTLNDAAPFWLIPALCIAAAAMSGYETFLSGVKNAVKLRFDESTLMTVAVIAAFCLGDFIEGAMVAVLFAIGEQAEDLAVERSRRDIEKLSQIRPDTALLLKDGVETPVPAESVEIGSIIIVKPHERVPLDGVVTGSGSRLDLSALTGESIPVEVTDGSEVMSGAVNGDGLLKIRTTKRFGDSTAARILRLVEDAAAQKGRREKLISRFAAIYTPIVCALALLLAVVPPIIGLGDFSQWIHRALAVLVASCPCAIVISVPLAYYAGIGSASRAGVLIKGGKYLEALAAADVFAFDKTGTLTTGKLRIDSVYALNGYSREDVLVLAAACEKYSSHPIAEAIKNQNQGDSIELSEHSEQAGCGVCAVYNGKKLSCGNEKLLNGKIPEKLRGCNVFLVYDGELIGAVSVSDTVRSEAAEVLGKLKNLGAKSCVMLTGDSKANAEKISGKLGLDETLSGLMPEDKLAAMKSLKENSRAVCFVGDGINDAPVLGASDCGIAMGLGSEAAIEAGDAVLSSGTIEQLPNAVRLARRALRTVKTNITFALAVKTAVIILAALGISPMWVSVLADTGVCVLCVLYTARLLSRGR